MSKEILKTAKECGFHDCEITQVRSSLESFYKATFNAGIEAADGCGNGTVNSSRKVRFNKGE